MTENGYGKRTRMDEYPVKGRGGLGVKTVQLTEARGQLVGALAVRAGYQVMLISDGGTVIRIPVEDVKRLGPRDAGRDRDAPARGREGLDAGAGRRVAGRRRHERRRDADGADGALRRARSLRPRQTPRFSARNIIFIAFSHGLPL